MTLAPGAAEGMARAMAQAHAQRKPVPPAALPDPPIEWCREACTSAPVQTYGLGTRIVSHVHHECWMCGGPVLSLGSSYDCTACGVGAGLGFTSSAPSGYDPELARDLSSPG